ILQPRKAGRAGYYVELLLAKAIQPNDLGAFAGLLRLAFLFGGRLDGSDGAGNCRGGQFSFRNLVHRILGSFELQAELYRGIEEVLDRLEGHHEPFGNSAEGEPDFEAILRHREIPELMLQDDRHLFRILREQPRRDFYAFGVGNEGDEEMMLSGQTMLCGVGQNAAQHATQSVARQNVISDVIGRHTSVLLLSIGW